MNVGKELAAGIASGVLPPFIGIRIKPFTLESYKRAVRTLDLCITSLAEAGGDPNRYIELGPGPPPVDAVVVALDALTRGSLAKRDERVMDEWYAAFLFPGFMLLLIEACLGTRRRVRFPEG